MAFMMTSSDSEKNEKCEYEIPCAWRRDEDGALFETIVETIVYAFSVSQGMTAVQPVRRDSAAFDEALSSVAL
jgi:hypothetical protein